MPAPSVQIRQRFRTLRSILNLRDILLKRKSAGTRAIGERLNTTMIFIASAVEDDGGDSPLFAALGNQLTDGLGRLDIAAALQFATQARLNRRCGDQRVAGRVVDQLSI